MSDLLPFQQTHTAPQTLTDESLQARALAALLTVGVGTGGHGTAALPPMIFHATTTAIFASISGESLNAPHVSLVEWLIAIRSFFSLSISDLATALQVRRPTVYAWMSGKAQPRAVKVDRIKLLYRVGKEFRSHVGGNATFALFRFEDGESVLDKLVEYGDSESELRKILSAVAPDVVPSRVSVADLRERYGFRRPSSAARDAALRDATIW